MVARYKRDGAAEWCVGTGCQAQAACTAPGSSGAADLYSTPVASGQALPGWECQLLRQGSWGCAGLHLHSSRVVKGSQPAEAAQLKQTT